MNELKEDLIIVLKEYVGESQESIHKMIEVLLKNLPKNCQELLNAIKNENWKEVRFYAHKTKYSFRILHMKEEMNLLEEMEKTAEEIADLYEIKKVYKQIEQKSKVICQALEEISKN